MTAEQEETTDFYCVVTGDVIEGIIIYGPYDGSDHASEAWENSGIEYLIVKLQKP